jgi:hypothetical protein
MSEGGRGLDDLKYRRPVVFHGKMNMFRAGRPKNIMQI